MKHFYGVIISEGGGKYCAAAVRFSENVNIKPFVCGEHIKVCQLCSSGKEATKTAEAWNEQYKANGTYYYSYCYA